MCGCTKFYGASPQNAPNQIDNFHWFISNRSALCASVSNDMLGTHPKGGYSASTYVFKNYLLGHEPCEEWVLGGWAWERMVHSSTKVQ